MTMRRFATGLLFVILAMFGWSAIASADPSVTVEPVSVSAPHRSQVTFTSRGVAATVKYGRSRGKLSNSVSLVPNQVVTVSLRDADTIYWQASSIYGTSAVHSKDTQDNTWFFVFIVVWFWCIAIFLGIACAR